MWYALGAGLGAFTMLVIAFFSNGFSGFFLVLFLQILVLGAFYFAIWQLASHDILFTFISLGDIKTVDGGEGNPIAVLANLPPGYRANDKLEIEEGEANKTYLQKKWGLYYFGLPPKKIHEYEFVHNRINPNIDTNTSSSDWTIWDNGPKKTKVLFWEIPHSYFVPNIQFKDRFSADVLFDTRSRVVKPLVAIYLRRGKFIEFAAQYVNAGVIEELRKFDFEDFSQNQQKTEGSPLAIAIVDNINCIIPGGISARLTDSDGVVMVGGFISRFDATAEEKKALEGQKIAQLEGEAVTESARQAVLQADQEAKRLQVQSEAELLSSTTKARGEVSVLKEAIKVFTEAFPNINPETVANCATELSVVTKATNPKSPVSVWGARNLAIGVNPKEKSK